MNSFWAVVGFLAGMSSVLLVNPALYTAEDMRQERIKVAKEILDAQPPTPKPKQCTSVKDWMTPSGYNYRGVT